MESWIPGWPRNMGKRKEQRDSKTTKRPKKESLLALSTRLSEMPVPRVEDEDSMAKCMLRIARLSHQIQLSLLKQQPRPLRLNDLHRWEKSLHTLNQAISADLEAIINPPINLDGLVEFFGQEMESIASQPGVDQEHLASIINRIAAIRK